MQELDDESNVIPTSLEKANAVINLVTFLNDFVLSNSDTVSNIDVARTEALEVADITQSRQLLACIQRIMKYEDEEFNTISSH